MIGVKKYGELYTWDGKHRLVLSNQFDDLLDVLPGTRSGFTVRVLVDIANSIIQIQDNPMADVRQRERWGIFI